METSGDNAQEQSPQRTPSSRRSAVDDFETHQQTAATIHAAKVASLREGWSPLRLKLDTYMTSNAHEVSMALVVVYNVIIMVVETDASLKCETSMTVALQVSV
eukprot:TRINITY_DN94188_c0_g1_i1.p1 TRINITY_DN94188_c0_g1~~TRINITY_DN94188_c0_g1_i1.p1  ORF type:complete len:103 (-),score=23.78 TRINITY_DN94188_c0_g1_i1:186-494(-)